MTAQKRWILIGAAGLALLLVAGGAALFLLLRKPASPLLQMVPADETVLFFHNMPFERIRALASSVYATPQVIEEPVLTSTVTDKRYSLALLRKPNGSFTWIGTPEFMVENNNGLTSLRGRLVFTAGEEPFDLAEGQAAFASDPELLKLHPSSGSTPWAFVREPQLQVGDERTQIILGKPTGAVLVTMSSATELSLRYTATDRPGAMQQLSVPRMPSGSCLASTSPHEFIRFITPVNTDTGALGDTVIAGTIEDMLKADVSLTYDVLPLLQATAVACRTDDDVLLMGQMDMTGAVWDRSTGALHESFTERAARGTVEEELVDGKYTRRRVVIAEPMMTEDRTENGWLVRQSLDAGNRGLITAKRGSRYVVATSREIFTQAMDSPAGTFNAIRAGFMPQSVPLSTFLMTIKTGFPGQNPLVWGLAVDNQNIATLTVRSL